MIGQIFYVGALEALAPRRSWVASHRSCASSSTWSSCAGPVSDFVDEGAYEFRHLLIRDAAYESLSKESRADLHVRFADWFEEQSGDRSAEYAEIVGWHLEQAHRYLSELGTLDVQREELARRAADRLAAAGWTASARGRVRRRESPVASPGVDADRCPQPATGARRPRRGSPLERAVPEADRALTEESSLRKGLGTSVCACELDSRSYGFGSRSIRPPTTSTWRPKLDARFPRGERRRLRGGSCLAGRLLGSLGSVPAGTYAPGRGARFRARPSRARPALPAAGPGRSARLAGVGTCPASQALALGQEILEQMQGHRGAEAFAMCFLGQARGMLGQKEAAGRDDPARRGRSPRARRPSRRGDEPHEGLGYFVEMVSGDWLAAEQEPPARV